MSGMEAVADKIVDRRHRPMIDKALGEDGEPRAFIDAAGVQAVARVMTDEWITNRERDNQPNHGPDMQADAAHLHRDDRHHRHPRRTGGQAGADRQRASFSPSMAVR